MCQTVRKSLTGIRATSEDEIPVQELGSSLIKLGSVNRDYLAHTVISEDRWISDLSD